MATSSITITTIDRPTMANSSITSGRMKLIVLLLIVFLSENVVADMSDWLMKINSASTDVNFSGTFVHVHGGTVEVMKVARRVTGDGTIQTHLRSLNEPPREVIRDGDVEVDVDVGDVWYSMPNQHIAVHDYRQTHWRGFPKMRSDDFRQMEPYYRFIDGADTHIANRLAHRIDIVPNDAYRYGYRLWADSITGLLLRSDLINQQDEIVEQYLFIDVEIGKDISDDLLATALDKEKIHLFGENIPGVSPIKFSDWRLTQIPEGYTLSKHIRRVSSISGMEVEHLVYTDGLSSVSIFIREIWEGQNEMNGLSRVGAVNVYHKRLNNHQITVMGEVPAETVKYLAQGLEHPSP